MQNQNLSKGLGFKLLICLTILASITSCNKTSDEPNTNSSKYISEITINGVTYDIGTTRWSTKLNTIFTDEGQKGNLEMSLPDTVKLGTYKFSDGYLMIGYENLPGYTAIYDKVNITITKIGSFSSYGSGNIEGFFSGTFFYYDVNSNGVATGTHEVQLSGKFSTTP